MRDFLAIFIVGIALAGCPGFMQDTGDPVVDARVNTIMSVEAACSTYDSALKVFTVSIDADEVTLAQIETAQDVKKTIDPLCTSATAPADPQAVINQIQIGVARLLAIKQRGGGS